MRGIGKDVRREGTRIDQLFRRAHRTRPQALEENALPDHLAAPAELVPRQRLASASNRARHLPRRVHDENRAAVSDFYFSQRYSGGDAMAPHWSSADLDARIAASSLEESMQGIYSCGMDEARYVDHAIARHAKDSIRGARRRRVGLGAPLGRGAPGSSRRQAGGDGLVRTHSCPRALGDFGDDAKPARCDDAGAPPLLRLYRDVQFARA